MHRMTRNAIILSALVLILLGMSLSWTHSSLTPRIWQLNEVLEQDAVLAEYPYDFRVVQFVNGVAMLTSPDAGDVPAERFLPALDPSLTGKAPTDPAMLAARERFSQHQWRAIQLMLSQPDVESVVWSLDRAWYHEQRIALQ